MGASPSTFRTIRSTAMDSLDPTPVGRLKKVRTSAEKEMHDAPARRNHNGYYRAMSHFLTKLDEARHWRQEALDHMDNQLDETDE